MPVTTLTLQFDVVGTNVSLANVKNFSQGIAGAAMQLEAGWSRVANVMENTLGRVTSRLTSLATIGAGIFVGSVYKMTQALYGLGSASVMVNQRFQEFEITMASSLKSAESARKITQEIAKITAYSPIPFKDIASTVTGFSVLPQLNAGFVKQAQNNQLGDVQGLLRRSVRLIEMMTAFRPDKNPDEALFSIREALGGEFRSIQRRFDVPLSIFTQASGMSIQQLKDRGPDAIFNALFKAFDNIVSSAAIQAKAKLPTVALDNFWEQIFQMPSLAVGRSGFNKMLNDRLFEWLQKATHFFTENPEMEGSGAFVTSGAAERIGSSITRIFYKIVNTVDKGIDRLLSAMGFGPSGGDIFMRTTAAVEAGFSYIATNLPKWITYAKAFFEQMFDVFVQLYKWIEPIVSFLGSHPNAAAALALIGPRNAVNMATSAVFRGIPGLVNAGGYAASGLGGVYSGAYGANTDPSRFFSPGRAGQVRVTDAGAELLAKQGYFVPTTGLNYRPGQIMGAANAATALTSGASMIHQTGVMAGLASAATLVAKLAGLTVAIGLLAFTIEEGIRTWVEVDRNSKISREASAMGAMSAGEVFSNYTNTPSSSVNSLAKKAQSSMGTANRLLAKARAGDSTAAETLARFLGVPVVEQWFGSEPQGGGMQKGFKINDEWVDLTSDEGVSNLANEISKKALDYKKAVIALYGTTFTAVQGAAMKAMQETLKASSYESVEELLGQHFGFSDFKANVGASGQLSSSRLSTGNLAFLEEFTKKLDPNNRLRADVKTYDATRGGVMDKLTDARNQLMGLSEAALVNFIQGQIDTLSKLASQTGATEVELPNGQKVNISDRIKTLSGLQNSVFGPKGAKATMLAELNSSAEFQNSDNAKQKTAAFLKFFDTFSGSIKKDTFGPAFDANLSTFFKGLDVLTGEDGPFQKGDFENLKRAAKGMAMNLDGLPEYDALTRVAAQGKNYEALYKEATNLVGKSKDFSEDIADAFQAMSEDAMKGAEASHDASQRILEFLRQISLDYEHAQSTSMLRALRDAQGRGLRVSTDSIRSASEREALSGNYGAFDGMSQGFNSQFKVGDDFMNMAREGIALAQTMKTAFADAFSNIVLGTQSVGEAFRNMAGAILEAMARIFAQKAAEMLLNMVFNAGVGSLSGATSSGASSNNPIFASPKGALYAASGGFITRGRGGIDDVPAMLMRGEYVLNARAVQALGKHNLDAWNTGRFARYAEGGSAGMNYSAPSLSAHTAGNQYNFGDVHYHSNGGGGSQAGLDPSDMKEFQRQHRAMTIQLIEEHERKRRRAAR